MEDFFYAGGLRALLAQLGRPARRRRAHRATAARWARTSPGAKVYNDDVIRAARQPARGQRRASRCSPATSRPGGAVIKPAAMEARLQQAHAGRPSCSRTTTTWPRASTTRRCAVDGRQRASCCRAPGPQGAPGMPEWGQLPIPKKLLKQGVRDMVRISDARMSGTSYGACVLHVTPESHVGGPLALVRDGDLISIDVPARRLELLVDEAELARRRAAWKAPAPRYLARLRRALPQARHAGRPGLRLRLPRGRRRHAGSRDPLGRNGHEAELDRRRMGGGRAPRRTSTRRTRRT